MRRGTYFIYIFNYFIPTLWATVYMNVLYLLQRPSSIKCFNEDSFIFSELSTFYHSPFYTHPISGDCGCGCIVGCFYPVNELNFCRMAKRKFQLNFPNAYSTSSHIMIVGALFRLIINYSILNHYFKCLTVIRTSWRRQDLLWWRFNCDVWTEQYNTAMELPNWNRGKIFSR